MEVAIWGSGELGKYALNLLDRKNCNVISFVENDCKLVGKVCGGVPIISFGQLQKEVKEKKICVLLAVRNTYNIIAVLRQLQNCEVASIGILKPRIIAKNVSILIKADEDEGEIIWVKKDGARYNIVPRLELNIVDGCNLNCKACSHFSSLFPKESVYPIEKYKKDLERVKLLGKVLRLRLLGGEPLLARNLDEYLSIARAIFPEADIELVTNGLLIPNVNEKILKEIRNNDISLTISPYCNTLKIRDQIGAILEKYKIWWRFDGEEIQEFYRKLTLRKDHDGEKASENCLSKSCTFLREGKIYKCPLEGLISKVETKYNIQFKCENRGIDLYDEVENVYSGMLKLIMEPVEMCQYCSETNDCIQWEIKKEPVLQDWLCKE